MAETVYLIGTGRTDFSRNLKREGRALRDVIVESARAAIDDAGIAPGDIQSGVVGNFAAGLFARQLHLGSFLTEVDESLRGIPTLHTEAACASGAVAVLTGAQQVMGGMHDVVLVVGAEQQKTMSPAQGGDVLGAAGDYDVEKAEFGDFLFPRLFGRIAEIYRTTYGLEEIDLARVAVKNRAHANLNPQAQLRDSTLALDHAMGESAGNPRIAPPLKVSDCSQITDGAAAIVLCSERFLNRMARRGPRVRLQGFGHTTDYLPLARKDTPVFSIARKAAAGAFRMAQSDPTRIDGAEVHDCFSISEIIATEILGFAPPGGGADLLRSGATALPRVREALRPDRPIAQRAPIVNAGGGLIGDGHPVGASGVRQVGEAYRHLTGAAGDRQVRGARTFLTFNMGGTFTTSVVMIWGAGEN